MIRIIWVGIVSLALVVLDSSSLLADGASDLAIEKRMWVIAEDLDCPVCEGQSVRESNAALAVQMRNTIVTKLQAGHSKDQIMQFFADRYCGILRAKASPLLFGLARLSPSAVASSCCLGFSLDPSRLVKHKTMPTFRATRKS